MILSRSIEGQREAQKFGGENEDQREGRRPSHKEKEMETRVPVRHVEHFDRAQQLAGWNHKITEFSFRRICCQFIYPPVSQLAPVSRSQKSSTS